MEIQILELLLNLLQCLQFWERKCFFYSPEFTAATNTPKHTTTKSWVDNRNTYFTCTEAPNYLCLPNHDDFPVKTEEFIPHYIRHIEREFSVCFPNLDSQNVCHHFILHQQKTPTQYTEKTGYRMRLLKYKQALSDTYVWYHSVWYLSKKETS